MIRAAVLALGVLLGGLGPALGQSADLVEAGRTAVVGYSFGAKMVWNLACYRGDRFAAYTAVGGGFWSPYPTDCPGGPANFRHIHGLADRVVPIDNRTGWGPQSILAGMAFLRRLNGCGESPPDRVSQFGLECRVWNACGSGRELHLCTHPEGHKIEAPWLVAAHDWMRDLARDQMAEAP